jgi:hypothetical protein
MLLLAEGKEPELTLEQLYQIKGQAVTQIEIAQNTLKFANEKISEVLSKAEEKSAKPSKDLPLKGNKDEKANS